MRRLGCRSFEKINEQWVGGLKAADVAAILRTHGFIDVEDISFQQIVCRFSSGVQGLAPGQIGVHVVHAKRL